VVSQRRYGDVTVVDAVYAPGTIDPPHAHDELHASVVLDGDVLGVLLHDGTAHVHRRSQTVTHDPGVPHMSYFAAECRVLTVVAPAESARNGAVLSAMTERLAREHAAGSALLRRFATERFAPASAPAWLSAAVTMLANDGTAVRDVARSLGISLSRLERAFRRHLGTSPRASRRQAKLRGASRRLVYADDALATVALASGFCDQSHLTSAFVRAYGVTPRAFRRMFATTSYKTSAIC